MYILDIVKYYYRQLRRPKYLQPEPMPRSPREIKATRKKWAERERRRRELEESREWMSYIIPDAIHLEDYIDINTNDWAEPNPILYQIVVPLPKTVYYHGKKWLVSGSHCSNFNGSNSDLIKSNISDIHRYNISAIEDLRRCADKIDHYIACGIDGVNEIM